jgi:uncharacterized protein YggT (Ycf19 family)
MRARVAYTLNAIVNFVFGLIATGLIIRFLFRLFGANPSAPIVLFIYRSTAPLLEPFRNIFAPVVVDPGNVLEFSTLVAIVFYLLFAWLLTEIISYVSYRTRTYYGEVDEPVTTTRRSSRKTVVVE